MTNQSEQQSFNGFLVVDKPKGWTSFDVVAKLRKELGVRKIGHCGTLDPMATGVLVIGVGKAVKLFEYMSGLEKEYEALVELGKVSDTDDAEGEVSESGFQGKIDLSEVEKVLEDFRGEIEQVPPAFSAVKVAGRRAYDLARKGRIVSLAARKVKIFQLRLIWYEFPKMRIRVVCSGGTYIRSLARDIGKKLECGAILTGLTRTRVGEFHVSSSTESPAPDLVLDASDRGSIHEEILDQERSLVLVMTSIQGQVPDQEQSPSADSGAFPVRNDRVMTEIFPLSVAVKHMPRIDLTLKEFQALQKGQKIPVRGAGDGERHPENCGEIFAGFYQGELVSILKVFEVGFLRSVKNL